MKSRVWQRSRKQKTGDDRKNRTVRTDQTDKTARTAKKRSFRAFWHLIRSFIRKMSRDKLDVYSAQSSFYLVMGMIPTLMLMFMFLKFTPLSEEMILDTLSAIMDESVMSTVQRVVGNVYHGPVTLLSIASLMMLWVASRSIIGLSNGLNSIDHVKENRNFLVMRLRAMVYTILLIVSFITALGFLVAGLQFRIYLSKLLPIFRIHNTLMRYAFMLIGLVLMTLIFNLLYVFLPTRRKRFLSQMYGAVFTSISWAIFTWIFTIYLTFAKNLSIVYGGLLTMMVTLLWLYYCLLLFFFGAEINAWKENPDSFPF